VAISSRGKSVDGSLVVGHTANVRLTVTHPPYAISNSEDPNMTPKSTNAPPWMKYRCPQIIGLQRPPHTVLPHSSPVAQRPGWRHAVGTTSAWGGRLSRRAVRRGGELSKASSVFSSSMCTPPRQRCWHPCTPLSFPSPRGLRRCHLVSSALVDDPGCSNLLPLLPVLGHAAFLLRDSPSPSWSLVPGRRQQHLQQVP
jgi:hypothetical protein